MASGGKRPGAGRKPGSLNKITALKKAAPEIKEIKGASAQRAVTAAAVLGCIDELKKWLDLLDHKDPRVRIKALCYLTDQRDGKAKQRVEASGDSGGPIIFALESIGAPK
jgi:hypothetical protein